MKGDGGGAGAFLHSCLVVFGCAPSCPGRLAFNPMIVWPSVVQLVTTGGIGK